MTPKSDAIWKVAGDLYDDKGNLDAKKLNDQQWTDMNLAAVAMSASAKTAGRDRRHQGGRTGRQDPE